ncbi:MAG TPA: MraY family glycosyltransferase [Acidimicrobiales bacterium]|nr:MraY family glycosyltransferase [Acidimicrobiales bacterium]
MADYLAQFAPVVLAAALVTFATTPFFQRLSFRIGAVQRPDARRVHTEPTALLGGAAIFAGFLAGMLVAWPLDDFAAVFDANTIPLGVTLGAAAMFGVGQLDDLRDVSPPAKLAGTVLSASILSIAGVSILFFRIPFAGLLSLSPDMSALLTVLWVIGMTTAINYIDGLDGLAAGIVGIGAAALLLYCERLEDIGAIGPDNVGPIIAAAVLGACLGFLPHNFHPAHIFMGDAGALLLGILMAAATIAVGGNTDAQFSGQTFFFFAPLFIPLVILGVPIFDTAFSILRRARRGARVTVADKDHLHHRLMRLGHGQRRSVLILWGWTVLLSAIVLYPTYNRGRGDLYIPFALAAAALVLYTMFGAGIRARGEDRELEDQSSG